MSGDRRPAGFLQWRNWSLPTKLAAVVLVPVLFAITLGVGQIQWQVEQADEYGRVAQVLDAEKQVEPLLSGLQQERNHAVDSLVGDGRIGAFTDQAKATDKAAEDLRGVITDNDVYTDVVGERFNETRRALDALGAVRAGVQAHRVTAVQAIGAYSQAVRAALALDRALTTSVADPRISSSATAMTDLLGLTEEVRLQQSLVLSGLDEGSLDAATLDNLSGSRARLLSKINDAGSGVAKHWQQRLQQQLQVPAIVQRNQMLGAIISESTDDVSSGGFSVSREAWNSSSDGSAATIEGGRGELAVEIRSIAQGLADDASDRAGWDSVLLLASLIAAAGVIIMITRQLLGSLRELRIGALDAAEYDLPQAVTAVREGKGAEAEVPPLPVTTTEEVGQVARAFDEVNRQALRLAVEQADLRRGYSDAFVSVSRRSQALLERQLRLFEELEQDEEDPDQLSRLFQLDNLATRMRRNNENLMVLSGSDLARRFTQPTDLADVLRSAVSEIEQYPRIAVQPTPSVKLRGNTASDLVRLTAELMDNGANFSAPDTVVTVSSYQSGDGTVVLDILDNGIGMGDEDLAEANERLARVAEDDISTSRRMGLFVAGRLAARHGISVELHGGPDVEGVRATVLVPAEHVVSAQPGPSQMPPSAQPAQVNGHSLPGLHNPGTFPGAGSLAGAGSPLPQRRPDRNRPEDGGWQTQEPSFAQDPGTQDSGAHDFSGQDFGGQDIGAQDFGSPEYDNANQPTSLFEPIFPQDQGENSGQFDGTGFFEPAGGQSNDFFAPAGGEDAPTSSFFGSSLDYDQPAAEEAPEPAPEPVRNDLAGQWFMPAASDSVSETGEFHWPETKDGDSALFTSGPSADADDEPQLTSSGLPQRKPRNKPAEPVGSTSQESSPGRSAEDISKQIARGGVQFGSTDPDSAFKAWPPDPSEPAPELPEAKPWIPQTAEAQAWDFAADKAREAAEAAANPQETSFTSAGLPRRKPKANLVPGSVSDQSQQPRQPRRLQRDPNALRSRLSDFQGGVSRGRHRMSDEG
ncbi:nitrate- and nitrite sensing domain-containing protein [Saccharopolyspora sp. TS4A08]|uniref:histidine kinase n=1 Tax=Saccharopolyspora ipomoeae TaxID=3042027 RepID=A0ABT6PUA4_9PSEU|nr:nitrate- and nitrite sensing domain-containing protein [Saccharopolyspora sp. TS4A08]MDI2031594.1 nitrate- and nitrite sensing domain-containing protein [Saccharopolyspora sp. TS4A08]